MPSNDGAECVLQLDERKRLVQKQERGREYQALTSGRRILAPYRYCAPQVSLMIKIYTSVLYHTEVLGQSSAKA